MKEIFCILDFCVVDDEPTLVSKPLAPSVCVRLANNKIAHFKIIETLIYYAKKHGQNSKAAVLLKELGIEMDETK